MEWAQVDPWLIYMGKREEKQMLVIVQVLNIGKYVGICFFVTL